MYKNGADAQKLRFESDMAERGGQPGNQNAVKGRIWSAAIERAFRQRSKAKQREEMDALAEVLIEQAFAGDISALKEVGDRLEGKPAQSVHLGNEPGEEFVIAAVERRIVRAEDTGN